MFGRIFELLTLSHTYHLNGKKNKSHITSLEMFIYVLCQQNGRGLTESLKENEEDFS